MFRKECHQSSLITVVEDVLDEGNLRSVISKIANGFLSIFRKLTNTLGDRQSIKFSVDIPDTLYEANTNRQTGSGSSRKSRGSLVEVLSIYHLAVRFKKLGFKVQYGLNGKISNDPKLLRREIIYLKQKIVSGIDVELDSPTISDANKIKLLRKKEKLPNEIKELEEYAIATADRIELSIKKDKNIYPLIYSVKLEAAGEAGTGKTKADFNITYEAMDEKSMVSVIKEVAISHKYKQQQAFGEQKTYLSVFKSFTGKDGKNGSKSEAYEAYERFSGQKSDKLIRFGDYIGSKSLREGNPKEYKKLTEYYYTAVEKLLKSDPMKLLKMVGIEEGVEHFFVNKTKEGTFKTYYSANSKMYKELHDNFYAKNVKNKIKLKTQQKEKAIEFTFTINGEEIYTSDIHTFESDTNKTVHVSGISLSDFIDQEIERELTSTTTDLSDIDKLPAFDPSASGRPEKYKKEKSSRESKDLQKAATKLLRYAEKENIDPEDIAKLRKKQKIEMIIAILRGDLPEDVFADQNIY